MSKKLSVLFLGFVMLLSVLAPKVSFADSSIYDYVVTIAGEEYVISPDEDSMEFNVDDFIAEAGLQETDKVEKFTVYTPDGVESVTFEFLTLNPFFPDATIQVTDGKAEYVVSEVLGELDKQSDGVSIQLLRQLMYPVNYQAWVTATADYANGDYDVLDVLFTSNDSLEVPATNAVELDGITLVTDNGPVQLEKLASNQFYLDLSGKNGETKVTEVKFFSSDASTLSTFSNDSSLYRDETDLKFVDGVATMNVEKLKLSELADIIGEGTDYLTTFQDMRYMVASLGQDTFNAYVAAENAAQSPFQVVVGIEGWVLEGGKWYYYDFEGDRLTDTWIETDGEWRYLSSTGAVKTGWLEWEGDWYYLDAASKPIPGEMVTGWKRIDGKTYYFDEDGVMAKGLTKIKTSIYYFDEDLKSEGALVTGWEKINGKWYFFNKTTGAAEIGWEKISGVWYFFDENGVMQTSWKFIGGKWFYFNTDGSMKTGWFKQGTKWYLLDKTNGDMKTGWAYDSYKWYYFAKDSGVMKTGWVKDAGTWYLLDNGGAMKTGWVKDAGKWYFLAKSGKMQTGWLNYSSKWYYLDNGGVMKTGWVKIGTKWYYMYSSGVMAANTTIGGYRLGKDGAWIQ